MQEKSIKDFSAQRIWKIFLCSMKMSYYVKFLEHPKHECLSQTTAFKPWWHIVLLIRYNGVFDFYLKGLAVGSFTLDYVLF